LTGQTPYTRLRSQYGFSLMYSSLQHSTQWSCPTDFQPQHHKSPLRCCFTSLVVLLIMPVIPGILHHPASTVYRCFLAGTSLQVKTATLSRSRSPQAHQSLRCSWQQGQGWQEGQQVRAAAAAVGAGAAASMHASVAVNLCLFIKRAVCRLGVQSCQHKSGQHSLSYERCLL
jgi:hypothetical protein